MDFTDAIQPHGLSLIIYGPPGIGKTSLAAEAPGAVLIDLEGGVNALRKDFEKRTGKKITSTPKTIETYDEFIEALEAAAASKFKTVVIDTVSALEQILSTQVIAEYNDGKPVEKHIKSISQIPYGQGSDTLAAHFALIMKMLGNLQKRHGKNVVLVAHSAVQKVEDPTSENYDRFTLDINKKSSGVVANNVDAVFFCRLKTIVREKETKGKHMAKTTGQKEIQVSEQPSSLAKNRFGLSDNQAMTPEIYKTIGME